MPDPANKPQLGRYTLLSELGRGGFAIVYHALDTSLTQLADRRSATDLADVRRVLHRVRQACESWIYGGP